MFYEINAEPDVVIYMCARLLLDPFQLYLEMSVVFSYPYIQPLETAALLGMKCVGGILIRK